MDIIHYGHLIAKLNMAALTHTCTSKCLNESISYKTLYNTCMQEKHEDHRQIQK